MSQHLTPEQVQLSADREGVAADVELHIGQCSLCANAILDAQRMKNAVRDAMRTTTAPAALRRRVTSGPPRTDSRMRWFAVAAVAAAVLFSAAIVQRERSRTALSELVDLHATSLASANPIDVVSTDRHTVKPWFEGRVSFAVPVPDLSSTPFRLIGGRVVYWKGNPAACLLIGKGAHRISVFAFPEDSAPPMPGSSYRGVSVASWHEPGLTLVAIADIPSADLEQLRVAFTPH